MTSRDLLGWQPDLRQRYELLDDLLHHAFAGRRASPVTVLDVGSGPLSLTQNALGEAFVVVRADVTSFGDPDIVTLDPGQPLPFGDDTFEVVVALDVIEHVPPASRARLVDECARVARSMVVLTFPADRSDVRAAERDFAAMALVASGRRVEFLEEHDAYGLVAEHDVLAALNRTCRSTAVVHNAPLATWAVANTFDFIVDFTIHDPEVKARINRAINVDSVVCPPEVAAYRAFVVGSPSGIVDLQALMAAVADNRPPQSNSDIVAAAVEALAVERGELVSSAAAANASAQAIGLERSGIRVERNRVRRANDLLAAELATADDQIRALRNELIAANASTETLRSVVNVGTPVRPPSSWRSAGAKTRRSPRWAARKIRRVVDRARAVGPASASADSTPADQAPTRFDSHWYILRNPDVGEVGADPWVHYRDHGRFEGRSPHALFDRAWYVTRYPESVVDEQDPFSDWATTTNSLSRDPNEFFDTQWYLSHHPDVAEAGLDPVEHYRLQGWREGRRPGPLFDPQWYLGMYPDVAVADIDPLTHFIQFGRSEGRHANHLEHIGAAGSYRPPAGLIPWFSPVNFSVQPGLADQPVLNVLVPGLGTRHFTGGPNTAIALAYRLAARGRPVRFIATEAALDDDVGPLWAHMASISDVGERLTNVEIIDGSNRYRPVDIGENDLFMATAWWTAQSIRSAFPLLRHRRFLYLIQDFEPMFFAASSQYALAMETYGLDHVPVVNTRFLLDHLAEQRVGRFADDAFVGDALVFEPAVDTTLFFPAVPDTERTARRLLLYARPQNGLRNLFELGVAAIQLASQQGVFDDDEWEFCGMGEDFSPVAVGPRSVLRPLPWRDMVSYASQMRQSDVLLSPMLAPHPSYPPLEMAACAGVVVTTEFGPKTAEQLAAISPNIIGTSATIDALAQGLADAVDRLSDPGGRLLGSRLDLPSTWTDALHTVLPEVEARLAQIEHAPRVHVPSHQLLDRYSRWRTRSIVERSERYGEPTTQDVMTFSLLTPVWNTPAEFLSELASSVVAQDTTTAWEWVITDNGSTDPATLGLLETLASDERITVVRHEENLGILGGMRSCLDAACGRYILHLDHDDVLSPDALRIVASVLAGAGWPKAFYTDEDKLRSGTFIEPYLKPDWDPVLFTNSCYIAHLCGVDRETALELGAYTDPGTEASPDWDLFVRFANAGLVPLHIPEVVYSWRIHPGSTAGDTRIKPYAIDTHRKVLARFLEPRAGAENFDVEIHPESPDRLDWWIRRRETNPRPLVSVVVGTDGQSRLRPLDLVEHSIHTLGFDDADTFREIADDASARGALLHVVNSTATLLRDGWYWEALGLMELHPDVKAVGGPVVRSDRFVSVGQVFGFGPDGWGSPAESEPSGSPGWFALNLKQHSVDGLTGDHVVYDANRLASLLNSAELTDLSTIGAHFSLAVSGSDDRLVCSPLLRSHVERPFSTRWSPAQRLEIGREAARRASGRNRSTLLSLNEREPFAPSTHRARQEHLRSILDRKPPPSTGHEESLRLAIRMRSDRYHVRADAPSVSVITPVYAGTDAWLLRELSESLAAQTVLPSEWIIGLDGKIGPELRSVVDDLVASGRAHLTGGPKVGILGTMRGCLAAASADYVVPVDADDLLTIDAISVLTSVAATRSAPDLIYSDEDILDDGRLRDPFVRPDWDPVLHSASSYAWHALCIKRVTALDTGLYSDPAFEWCHDWDTVERVRRSGGRIVHVPEVLYHWRRHSGSSTNTDGPKSAQADSVKAMFTRFAAETGHPERYEIVEYPLWRGATEFHLRRLHVDPPAVTLLSLGELSAHTRASISTDGGFPIQSVVSTPVTSTRSLAQSLTTIGSELVWILDGNLIVCGSDSVWQTAKWFELVPDVAAVCGRRVDLRGRVTGGADVLTGIDDLSVVSPIAGRAIEDPGPFALALKPQTIEVIDFGCVLARRVVLLEALNSVVAASPPAEARIEVSRKLVEFGGRIMYDPLLVTCGHGNDDEGSH